MNFKGSLIRKERGYTWLSLLLLFALCSLLFAQGADAYYVKQQWVRVSAVCGETITVGQMVAIADADGYAYKADANVSTLRPAIGIAGKGCVATGKVEIVVVGIVSGWTSLSEGTEGYLSETPGAVTQSAPTWNQQVGVALNTTDYLINCKNYLDTSALTTLGVLAGASPLSFEGATANDYETTVAVTDPTADRTVTVPDAGGTVMLSSLATNGADAANAVTGASNGLVFEGATANDYETTIAPTDPTADRTITLPDATGTVALRTGEVTTATDTLTAGECGKVIFLNSGTEFATTLPAVSTVAIGCQFEFIVKAAASGANYTIVTGNSLENKIYGSMEVAGAVVACADEDTITLVDGNAIGDWVKVISDGANWYISGSTVTTAKATCTAAD